MENINWQIQTSEPLFPDTIWDKPENKKHANSLLIIGGNSTSFNFVSKGYDYAQKIILSNISLVLPKPLEQLTKNMITDCFYGVVNNSGGYNLENLGLFNELAETNNNIVLIGNFGDSSETHLLIEKFINSTKDKLFIITNDAIDFLTSQILENEPNKFLLLAELTQVQKLIKNLKRTQNFKSSDNLYKILQVIKELTSDYNLKLISKINDSIYVFSDNKISSTKVTTLNESWQTTLSIECSSWIKYESNKQFENLTTAVYQNIKSGAARRT